MHFHTIVAMYFFRRYSLRPKTDPYCQAGVIPFCPTGEPANAMPQFVDTDQIEVYALKVNNQRLIFVYTNIASGNLKILAILLKTFGFHKDLILPSFRYFDYMWVPNKKSAKVAYAYGRLTLILIIITLFKDCLPMLSVTNSPTIEVYRPSEE
jgi:hypothetical protein